MRQKKYFFYHFLRFFVKTDLSEGLLSIEADKHVKLVKIVRQKNHSLLLFKPHPLILNFSVE
jgi:hypothetical protein